MDREKNTILITGGCGFIGSYIVEEFVKTNNEVIVLDNLSHCYFDSIKPFLKYKNFRFIKGDVRNFRLVEEITKNVDAIFHLAAQIHVDKSVLNPNFTFDVNVRGTLNVLNAALKNDVKKFFYISSCEIYGTTVFKKIDESHTLNPTSPYAASKVAADRLCFSYYKSYGLNTILVRPFNNYGPRQMFDDGSVIPIFVKNIFDNKPPIISGDGTQTRDFIHVKDVARAFKLIFDSRKNLAGRPINLGSGVETSILSIARKLIKLIGKRDIKPRHAPPRKGELMRSCADITFAKNELGFSPEYNIDRGLMEYIKWFKDYYHVV
jgi:UDP-glucose 4-epimerase